MNITDYLTKKNIAWKPIEDFSSYIVTEEGEIFNVAGTRLSPYSSNGYKCIKIKDDDGRRKTLLVHRVVLIAFKKTPKHKMWANHIDGDKANNYLDNLEWSTPKQNHIHARDVLKRNYAKGEQITNSKLTELSVKAIRQLYAADWSQHKLAELFGVTQPAIHKVVSDKTWKP